MSTEMHGNSFIITNSNSKTVFLRPFFDSFDRFLELPRKTGHFLSSKHNNKIIDIKRAFDIRHDNLHNIIQFNIK